MLLNQLLFRESMMQVDDARTNLAIALSAAEEGAAVSNHTEMIDVLFDDQGIANGVQVVTTVSWW